MIQMCSNFHPAFSSVFDNTCPDEIPVPVEVSEDTSSAPEPLKLKVCTGVPRL